MQPPARCTAGRAQRLIGLMNIKRNNAAVPHRGGKGRIIGETQVVSEPDEGFGQGSAPIGLEHYARPGASVQRPVPTP